MCRTLLKCFFIISALLFYLFTPNSFATEQFAQITQKDCSFCHLNSAGGGELTQAGENFLAILSADQKTGAVDISLSGMPRLLRLIVGYIHILTGVFWFGTILYVHTVLKPAYASRGLPRGEVRVGLISIFIMAITGTVLTFYRVPSFSFLITTRFGVLLVIKISLFLIMATSAFFVVFFLSKRLKKRQAAAPPLPISSGNIGIEELKQFDGKEGRPAYIAYKGEIFDVSESKLWKDGQHMGRHHAGTDLTEALAQAPHGEEKIFDRSKHMGQLSTQEAAPILSPPARIFYFMAYMNLSFVFLIVLILALWRWW